MPGTPPLSGIAAGAAWGAAKDAGLNDLEQLHAAEIAVDVVEKERQDQAEKALAAHPVRPDSPKCKSWWQVWRR